jgi:hypothetical protein
MNAPLRVGSLCHGRFELGPQLGAGAVGIVYDAFDRERGARVALKLLRSLEPELLISFKTEFRAAHDLGHPNLVELGELFEDEGHWFFTMELVRGVHFLRGGYDEARLRGSLLQLAEGLGALHAARILHRDVKPSNILVEANGRVVLLDFGLAMNLRSRSGTGDEAMRGTVAYMAPEQITAEGLSPATDWYAVGVLLYEGLTGKLPFDGTAHEMVEQKLTCEPRPVEELAPSASPDLSRLCAALLRSDPAERAGEREVRQVLEARVTAQSATVSLGRAEAKPGFEEMVGRTAELESLDRAFSEALAGRATSVVVHGESGVGKSFLVNTFAERCFNRRPNTLILHGRCYERETVPYKAVDGAIDELASVLHEQPRDMVAKLMPDDVELLASLFPVLKELREVGGGPSRQIIELASAQDLRQRAFAALRELFVRVSAWRPVLLLIDDLQWADSDSLALLHELLRPPSAPALLVLCTRRITAGLERVPTGLPGEVRELALAKLPDGDASALVRQLLAGAADDEAEVASIARESQGHPLFIAELVQQRRERASGEPVRLDEALWARVEALPEPTRDVLSRVCVAGLPIPQEIAARASGLELGELFFHVAKLRAANLLRTAGVRRRDLVEPFHDRVRESVVAHLSADLRRRVHRQLADAFERTGTDDPEALTTHWQGAGEAQRAADYAVKAGDRAARALAFDRAARFYQLARELRAAPDAEQTELLGKLAQALNNAGRGEESARVCQELASCTSGTPSLDLRRLAAERLMCSGHHERGLALLRELCRSSGIYIPRARFMVVLSVLCLRLVLRVRGLSFRERAEADIDPARLARVDLMRSAMLGLIMTDHLLGAYFKAVHTLFALATGEPRRVIYALTLEAAVQSSVGPRVRKYVEHLQRHAEELAATRQVEEAPAWFSLARGYTLYFCHELQRGHEELGRAEAAWQANFGERFHLASLRALLYRLISQRGELRELANRIGPTLREVEARGDVYAELSYRTTTTPLLALAADDPAEARMEMERVRPKLVRGTFMVQHYFALITDVRIDLYEGRGRDAHARMNAAWPEVKKSLLLHLEVIRHVSLDHRARAALAAAAEVEGAAAARLLEEAERIAGQLEKDRVPAAAALARMIRACVADQRGQASTALGLLTRAEKELDHQGLGLHHAAAQRRLGELIGDGEGATKVAAADAWLAAQGVRNPRRFCAMLYPTTGLTQSGTPPRQ